VSSAEVQVVFALRPLLTAVVCLSVMKHFVQLAV